MDILTQIRDAFQDGDDTVKDNALSAALTEIERLQSIIDSRPAINAGLPGSYIQWSQSIYEIDAGLTAKGVTN